MHLLSLFFLLAQIPEVSGTPSDFVRMRIIEVEPGTGEAAQSGQKFTVHYTGWLTNGKKFDSSRDRNEPFTFTQGQRQVIAGWEAGFEGMKVGGKRRLLIPYQLAYGEKGRGEIPAKAELIFDVELLKVEDAKLLPASQDVLDPFNSAAKKMVDLAKAIPEDKYDWRPAPGVRSFREVFIHVAGDNKVLLNIAKDNPPEDVINKQFEAQAKLEKEALPKDKIVAMLEDSMEQVRKQLEPLRAALLNREMKFFGQPTTTRGVYVGLETHMSEHLGQVIAYARMNGIKPPWSN